MRKHIFITNWMTVMHIVITSLFCALFLTAFHLNNTILIYAIAIVNLIVWYNNIFYVRKTIKTLIVDKDQWQLAATYDALTGVYNRGIFVKHLTREIQRSQRYKLQLSFIILDLDKFKEVNDNFGHSVGDMVLVKIANVIKNQIRNIDLFGRLGGEEFGIILPETDIIKAMATAERVRKSVEEISFENEDVNITISLGVTSLLKNDNMNIVYERADRALYKSKNNGRNKVFTID